jgi:glutamate synthase domain-containing protein 2
MTVKELIEKLSKMKQDAPVVVPVGDNNGCDTCGYGETYSEEDVVKIHGLETRVVLGWK